jgi:hypothetical protein
MRRKQIIPGLKNSQRIRVILNGIGFYTTVQGVTEMVFSEQRVIVYNALELIGREKIQGYGGQNRVYDSKMNEVTFDVQVNLA